MYKLENKIGCATCQDQLKSANIKSEIKTTVQDQDYRGWQTIDKVGKLLRAWFSRPK